MLPATATAEAENLAPEPAPDTAFAELARLAKAAADPLRLKILRALSHDSLGVLELCELLQTRQPALSHHLKVLTSAGLLASRREGTNIFYRRCETLASLPGNPLLQALFREVDDIPLPPAMARGMATLHASREANSRDFFRHNAHKFREQQDLIASYELYADTVATLLAEAPLQRRTLALEVGPGDGSFLRELSPAFAQVVALDNAPQMLQASRDTAAQHGLDNIRFILGDTRSAELAALAADCIVVNMVLHHTPKPAAMLKDLAGLLAPNGVIVLTDLCRHDQLWARDNCGDLWLGFEPEQLTAWAAGAGLADIASTFLAQRNGFQIQVRLFGHRNS